MPDIQKFIRFFEVSSSVPQTLRACMNFGSDEGYQMCITGSLSTCMQIFDYLLQYWEFELFEISQIINIPFQTKQRTQKLVRDHVEQRSTSKFAHAAFVSPPTTFTASTTKRKWTIRARLWNTRIIEITDTREMIGCVATLKEEGPRNWRPIR